MCFCENLDIYTSINYRKNLYLLCTIYDTLNTQIICTKQILFAKLYSELYCIINYTAHVLVFAINNFKKVKVQIESFNPLTE